MFESKTGIFLIAGLGFFAFAFLSNGLLPMVMYRDAPSAHAATLEAEKAGKRAPQIIYEQTVREVINPRLRGQVEDMARRWPEAFATAFGSFKDENLDGQADDLNELDTKIEEMLILGRQVYVGEGCWHCHSQFIRPVANESRRWGVVSTPEEYQNELQRPVMFGTRRVGPDLSREGGRRSNDWHAVHFFHPKTVSTDSPMPDYSWFFAGSPDKPNRRGLAIMTYVQWLGSWLDSYPYYEELAELESEE
jgi:cytochrome c oxidase cbb3-type subunit II